MARKAIPVETLVDLLSMSRRRCCICYGLHNDDYEKKGQIAHLDHDPSNNKLGNLAFLCLNHHDEYDREPGQAKGLVLQEVRRYRDNLYVHLKEGGVSRYPHVVFYGVDLPVTRGHLKNWLNRSQWQVFWAVFVFMIIVCVMIFNPFISAAEIEIDSSSSVSDLVPQGPRVRIKDSVGRLLVSTDWSLPLEHNLTVGKTIPGGRLILVSSSGVPVELKWRGLELEYRGGGILVASRELKVEEEILLQKGRKRFNLVPVPRASPDISLAGFGFSFEGLENLKNLTFGMVLSCFFLAAVLGFGSLPVWKRHLRSKYILHLKEGTVLKFPPCL